MTSATRSLGTRSDTELAALLLATLPRLAKLAAAQGHGVLTLERARLLWHLREHPLRSGDLAQRSALSAPAVSELVDSLVRDGLARRIEEPADRRVVVVELTGRGRRELERLHEHMTERIALVLSNLPAEKRARLRSALSDLQEAIATLSAETADAR